MKNIDELKFNQHLCMHAGPDMRELAGPLQKYGITHFAFSKIHRDQTTEILSTHPENSELFYNMGGYEHLFSGDVDSYVDCAALWDDFSSSSDFAMEYLKVLAESYNVAHGMLITKKLQDSIEFYYFATTPDNRNIYSFYLSNINVCVSFSKYFKDRAASLLEKSFLDRFYVPGKKDDTLLTSLKFQNLCGFSHKNSSSDHLNDMFMLYQLTKRERQCVMLLVEGRTCKQIADFLSISPRTVEKYIVNIKQRTNSKTLYQALSKLA